MPYYAVIDTNVLVAAILSKNNNSPTVKVVRAILDGSIIPLYHRDILDEYREVLLRPKFNLTETTVAFFVDAIQQFGKEVFPQPSGVTLIDMDDLIFYEVTLQERNNNAYLVTGNQKHYPSCDFIVTPAKMIEISGI